MSSRARLIGCGFGLVELGVGRPTFLPEFLGARFSGARLPEHAGRGAQFRLRLLGLQFEVDLVEGRERLAGNHEGADLNEALRHLSADTETQIAFDARANGADKSAIAGRCDVVDAGDQHRPDGGGMLRRNLVTARERQRQRPSRRKPS